MIVAVSRAEAAQRHRDYTLPNGTRIGIDTYIGTNLVARSVPAAALEPEPEVGSPYPMAYVVSQPAGTQIAPHYHQNDQFQLFLSGSGRIGRHELQPVTAHFAAAHSAYGPISADTALEYLTLRNGYDPGAQWLPAARDRLFATPGRQPRVETSASVSLDALPGEATAHEMIAFEGSGLGAVLYQLAPGARVSGMDPASGGGQFWFCLEGDFVAGGVECGRRACVFVSPEEERASVVAGGQGAAVIAVQFPRRAREAAQP